MIAQPDIQTILTAMFEAMPLYLAKLDENNKNIRTKLDEQARQNRSVHDKSNKIYNVVQE